MGNVIGLAHNLVCRPYDDGLILGGGQGWMSQRGCGFVELGMPVSLFLASFGSNTG